jgi:hypothetical protein
MTTLERLRAKITQVGDCWEWGGFVRDDGYGLLSVKDKTRYAHRLMYEESKGKIPEGLTIDHLCRNRKCINPEHLEAVIIQENIARAKGYRYRKDTCRRGRSLLEPGGTTKKGLCRICQNRLNYEYRRRKGLVKSL